MQKRPPFDLETAKQAILAEKVPFLDSAEAVLRRFGGTWFFRYQESGAHNNAHFDAKVAMDHIDPSWFDYYSKRIGKPVTPIGECGQGHATLMIDPDGKVYAGFDESLGKIADTIEEAIIGFTDKTSGRWEPIMTDDEEDVLEFSEHLSGDGVWLGEDDGTLQNDQSIS